MNKYSKGIVYSYADGSRLEISFDKISKENPTFTQEDFENLKAFSDEFYHEEAKNDCVYQIRYKAIIQKSRKAVSCTLTGEASTARWIIRHWQKPWIHQQHEP